MTPERKALLVVNRHSRRGANAAVTAADFLRRSGIQVVNEACEHAAGLPAMIRCMVSSIDRVAIGGDGTPNSALPGVLATGLPLGILPLGTANDLARTLGLPADLEVAAQVVAAEQVRRLDVGEVNGPPFLQRRQHRLRR